MSYIFEALKRLEQKRPGQGASRLLMITGEIAAERKKRPSLGFSVLATLLLLNAGVMIWWIRPWAPDKQSAPARPPAVDQREISAVQSPSPLRANEQYRPDNVKEGLEQKGGPQQKTAGISVAHGAVKESEVSRAKQATAVSPANSESQVPREGSTVSNGKLLDLKELPPAIKSSLPELKISAHYYTAERQARFTRINEQTLREGQALTPDVKLEEITPDGVVFSCQGRRFRIGVNESR